MLRSDVSGSSLGCQKPQRQILRSPKSNISGARFTRSLLPPDLLWPLPSCCQISGSGLPTWPAGRRPSSCAWPGRTGAACAAFLARGVRQPAAGRGLSGDPPRVPRSPYQACPLQTVLHLSAVSAASVSYRVLPFNLLPLWTTAVILTLACLHDKQEVMQSLDTAECYAAPLVG